MVNRDLIAAQLTELAQRMDRVRSHTPPTVAALRSNQDALDLVAFNLMLCVQSCAAMASHLIADEGWPAARSMAETFARLHEKGILSESTSDSLQQAVGLRNVVAHGYAGIDVASCHRAATTGLAHWTAFSQELARWLAANDPA